MASSSVSVSSLLCLKDTCHWIWGLPRKCRMLSSQVPLLTYTVMTLLGEKQHKVAFTSSGG